jgi:hypothetical protein
MALGYFPLPRYLTTQVSKYNNTPQKMLFGIRLKSVVSNLNGFPVKKRNDFSIKFSFFPHEKIIRKGKVIITSII